MTRTESGIAVLILILNLIAGSVLSQPSSITSFNDLTSSLFSGEKIRVVIHYKKCSLKGPDIKTVPGPEAVTGLVIDAYEYFAPSKDGKRKAFLVFSESKLIRNPSGKGFVYNYGKVRINEDNTVEITAMYLKPGSYRIKMEQYFTGSINNGDENGGVSLFKDN